jgi:AcrR family transcriptional regulator
MQYHCFGYSEGVANMGRAVNRRVGGAGVRPYDSSGRRARAAESRAQIVQVARDLFLEQGYGRTTIVEIAAAAGVSPETVYAGFRTKSALLHRAWDITVGGDDQDVVFHERPEVVAVRAEPDLARRLMAHAELSTRTARRISPFQLMVQSASGSDPAAAVMLEEMGRQRLVGLGVMASEAAATGQLAVSEEECRDLVWAMTDGVLWHRLVVERGWTDERYAVWLGQTWVAHLVAPAKGRTRRTGPR